MFGVSLLLWPTSLLSQQIAADQIEQGFAGSELEEYLRYLQTTGNAPFRMWSLRGFSPGEMRELTKLESSHPWDAEPVFAPGDEVQPRYGFISPRLALSHNSAFPYGWNDGPVWVGKGLTGAASAGFWAQAGPVTLVLAPQAFWAQNADFALAPNGRAEEQRFMDPSDPAGIDRPQRFGDSSYSRIDPGQSTLSVTYGGATAGISTANHIWGPASEHPILLGSHAPGFQHAFLGTARPLSIGIGAVHGRVIWGRLDDSPYALSVGDDQRVISGGMLSFAPRGLTGLEIGIARVFHSRVDPGDIGIDFVMEPFGGFLKNALPFRSEPDPTTSSQNQIASLFARWVLAPAGVEIYGEYAREDHSWDLRDFLLEIDQQRAYSIGLRKAWMRGPDRMLAVRTELVQGQVSNIKQVRPQSPFYRHAVVQEGHTNRGQVLGSAALFSGGGSVAAFDYYHPAGRWTVKWTRNLGDAGINDLPVEADVQHSLGGEVLHRTSTMELVGGIDAVYHLNRNLGDDAFNLHTFIEARIPIEIGL